MSNAATRFTGRAYISNRTHAQFACIAEWHEKGTVTLLDVIHGVSITIREDQFLSGYREVPSNNLHRQALETYSIEMKHT